MTDRANMRETWLADRFRRTRAWAAGRRRGDRGATVVEAAFAMPIFVLALFAAIELPLVLATYNGVGNATQEAARMASVQANSPTADQEIIRRTAVGASGLALGKIDYIIIWHAAGPHTEPPTNCKPVSYASHNTSSVGVGDGGPNTDATGACNVYIRPSESGGAFDMASGKAGHPVSYYFGCSGPSDPEAAHKLDCNWPGANRKANQSYPGVSPPKTPDYVGIYIHATHSYVTQLFGSDIPITNQSTVKIEPQDYVRS